MGLVARRPHDKASQSVPFAKISDHPLLQSAARICTPVMFKMVKEQIMKSDGWEIGEVTQGDGKGADHEI
jgi:hypothetical protein